MLTIFRQIEDLYLRFECKVLRIAAKFAIKKAFDCGRKRDVEGMKHWNELCRKLVLKREKAFGKRLWLRGY